ncbi:NAD(P)H-hydrate epimerase [Trichinella sp. T6]|nr:NAD(P)H-hydrate epimerase [Trichinella sp. T6]
MNNDEAQSNARCSLQSENSQVTYGVQICMSATSLRSILLLKGKLFASTFRKVSNMVKYLTQQEAINIDTELFDEYQFSVDQLMELAGLSCANSILKAYPPGQSFNNVLIVCGPGNNGGDGLVCARHLKMFNYQPHVVYPANPRSILMKRLLTQVKGFRIPISDSLEGINMNNFHLIVDAIFGFSFKPPAKEPYKTILQQLAKFNSIPVVSIDIPSGWHVEQGPIDGDALQPKCLISLTAPKKCAIKFRGDFHFLGGRFVPESVADKYQLNLPAYPEGDNFILINNHN